MHDAKRYSEIFVFFGTEKRKKYSDVGVLLPFLGGGFLYCISQKHKNTLDKPAKFSLMFCTVCALETIY